MLKSSILVALDGSELASQALDQALALLGSEEELVLLRVMAVSLDLNDSSPAADCTQEEATAYLDALAAPIRAQVPGLRCVVRAGNPSAVIVEVAAQERARLLVMASHGRTGPSRWLQGSVAEHVARKASCPVWLLHPGHQVVPVQTALVPLDTSARSEEAIVAAREQVAGQGGRLVLLTATQELESPDVEEPLPRYLRRYLDEMVDKLRQVGTRAESAVEEGLAVPAILRTAVTERADLIVMTSHGRSGPARWILGSVAEQVARGAPCPVLLLGPACQRQAHPA